MDSITGGRAATVGYREGYAHALANLRDMVWEGQALALRHGVEDHQYRHVLALIGALSAVTAKHLVPPHDSMDEAVCSVDYPAED